MFVRIMPALTCLVPHALHPSHHGLEGNVDKPSLQVYLNIEPLMVDPHVLASGRSDK